MKRLLDELVFGKNAQVSGLIALAVVLSIALGCNCGKGFDLSNLSKESNTPTASNTSTKSDSSDDSLPTESVTEALVKDTISQFSDAVDTGDFSEIYNNASDDFQSTYSLAEMKTAFKSYTDKKSMVVPILNKTGSMSPDFSRAPSIRTEKGLKILMAAGEFKTKPFKVRYDFEYVMRSGEWKLLKLVINIP